MSTAQFYAQTVRVGDCQIRNIKVKENGYSYVWDGGKDHRAHRWIYEKKNGKIEPSSMVIMHTCDHKTCQSLVHLKKGTYQENSDDMVVKGRSAYGEKHPNSRLKVDDIHDILGSGADSKELALEYGVTPRHINHILSGNSWHRIWMLYG